MSKQAVGHFVETLFAANDRHKSDLSVENHHALGAVTPLVSSSCSSPGRLFLVAGSSDIVHIFKNRLKALASLSLRNNSSSAQPSELEGA